ncbi:unnamed protein product [Blepharisma stoltei]|uniref:Uncharacterized protein n=1 Tax=Blepharisma stoltei TaxID=1481888 RepID=A0AAU9JTY7_9CILI|nr:unnamed protein product [Blepharisma stoltei]
MKGVTVVSAPTKTRKLVIYHMSFPWPLSDRELVVTFNALPNPEDKSCTIVMATPQTSTYLNSEIPPCDRGNVRINVPIGCLYVKYLSENLTRVVFVVSANSNIRYLPRWLVNFGSKHIMYSMMATLRNKIENFEGSIYEKRVQEKPEYYNFLREKIDISLHH